MKSGFLTLEKGFACLLLVLLFQLPFVTFALKTIRDLQF